MQHQLREIQQTFSAITHAVNTKVKKQTEFRAISKELNYFKDWKLKVCKQMLPEWKANKSILNTEKNH